MFARESFLCFGRKGPSFVAAQPAFLYLDRTRSDRSLHRRPQKNTKIRFPFPRSRVGQARAAPRRLAALAPRKKAESTSFAPPPKMRDFAKTILFFLRRGEVNRGRVNPCTEICLLFFTRPGASGPPKARVLESGKSGPIGPPVPGGRTARS